jgi:hypothetical protein
MEEKTRRLIAITIIATFCLIASLLFIIPYALDLAGYTQTDEIRTVYLDKLVSVFTGIIGVIIGYYFRGKNDEMKNES